MPVWQLRLARVAKQTLALMALQFLVVVILPDNAVGTSELPAVGVRKVVCSTDSGSVAPSGGQPAAVSNLLVHDLAICVGDHFLVESRRAQTRAADSLQLSKRLVI
jgi:hypothetical protein